MSNTTAADMIGLTIYAKRRIPILRWPSADSPVLRYIEAGRWIGIVRSWIDRKPGRDLWYWEFDDPGRGEFSTFYVAHIPGTLDMAQLREDFLERDAERKRRRMEWYERVLQDGGEIVAQSSNQVFKGFLALGALYVVGKIIFKK